MTARNLSVLHVIASLDPAAGGPPEVLRQYCLEVAGAPYRFEVASLDAPAAPWLPGFPAPVHALGPATGKYRHAPRALQWLRANAPRYDAVVVHGMWQFHAYAVRRALAGSATPYFLFPHGMLDPWFRRRYPLKHLKKWLYWIAAEYRVVRDARALLFTCEEESRLAPRSFELYRAQHAVAGFGIAAPQTRAEADREAFLAAYPGLRGRRVLLFLGRIDPKKGCDLLLDAFAAVARRDPALRLVMAGPDAAGWRARLDARGARLGIADRVVWTGMLSGAIKWGAFHAAEAFVLPSHQENFGIAVVEAIACRVPVLISDKVNIWREIEAAGAGLVAPDDVAGTRALLERWLDLGPERAAAMRACARAAFTARFHIAPALRRLVEIIAPHAPAAARGADA